MCVCMCVYVYVCVYEEAGNPNFIMEAKTSRMFLQESWLLCGMTSPSPAVCPACLSITVLAQVSPPARFPWSPLTAQPKLPYLSPSEQWPCFFEMLSFCAFGPNWAVRSLRTGLTFYGIVCLCFSQLVRSAWHRWDAWLLCPLAFFFCPGWSVKNVLLIFSYSILRILWPLLHDSLLNKSLLNFYVIACFVSLKAEALWRFIHMPPCKTLKTYLVYNKLEWYPSQNVLVLRSVIQVKQLMYYEYFRIVGDNINCTVNNYTVKT